MAFAAILACAGLQGQDSAAPNHPENASPDVGKRIYSSACTSCHGLDGRGTERAPNLANSAKIRDLSDAEIAQIISHGLPEGGMPAFHSLTDVQVQSIVAYLRRLQGDGDAASLPGNPDRGKELFFGKGACSSCHTIAGKGGFLGPDLTSSDYLLSAKDILDAIVKPNRIVRSGYRRAVVTTPTGDKVQGIVRNEDNFSVQLQSEDGTYHLFKKSALRNFEYLSQPLMPTDYGTRLTPDELNDLTSFVMRSSAGRKTTLKQPKDYDE
jgi:putative heme-binding domain-containing protein